jgi:hypothetical protein
MSQSLDRDSRNLNTHRATLEEMAKLNSTSNLERYKLGQLYFELTLHTDLSWEAVDQYLVENYQVQMPSRSSMSRLRSVYEVWSKQAGIHVTELAPFSPYLLYNLQLRTEITSRTAPAWLQRLRTYSRDQVLELAAGVREPKQSEFKTMHLPADVVLLINDAKSKLADAAGEKKLTQTGFLEFVAQLVLDSNDRSLRELWAKMHGEVVD